MAGKSQELISQLLAAEDEAERIISNAREARSSKMKNVKAAAEAELAPYRAREEGKFKEEQSALSIKSNISAELEKTTAMELGQVKSDYEENKTKVIKYLLDKVLDIDMTITDNTKALIAA